MTMCVLVCMFILFFDSFFFNGEIESDLFLVNFVSSALRLTGKRQLREVVFHPAAEVSADTSQTPRG